MSILKSPNIETLGLDNLGLDLGLLLKNESYTISLIRATHFLDVDESFSFLTNRKFGYYCSIHFKGRPSHFVVPVPYTLFSIPLCVLRVTGIINKNV